MDTNELLNELQTYMTTNHFMQKYNKPIHFKENSSLHKIKKCNDEHMSSNKTKEIKEIKEIKYKNTKYDFSPDEKDKLFWCFYIFINGYEKYELERVSYFKIEKEFKFMIAEKLNSLKKELKEMGLKKNDIHDELTNSKCISVKSLLVLCHIYKINLLYVKNNYYYLIEHDTNETSNSQLKCIVEENNKTYIKDIDNKDEQYYKENYWKIENMNKPIKSFSSYSLSELQDICKKLKLPIEINNKKMLKKDLYESIIKVF